MEYVRIVFPVPCVRDVMGRVGIPNFTLYAKLAGFAMHTLPVFPCCSDDTLNNCMEY